MNTINICGNIGAEPEFVMFTGGKKKVSFSIAINQYSKTQDKSEPIWIPCQDWDGVSDRLFKCRVTGGELRGRKINITGVFTQSIWVDQATGKKRTKLMVKVQAFELLSGLQSSGNALEAEDQDCAAEDLAPVVCEPTSKPATVNPTVRLATALA